MIRYGMKKGITITARTRFRPIAAALTLWLAIAAVAAPAARAQDPAPDRPPNIVFILADDLGWTDVSYKGSGYYETPNIDRLAARSVRFTNGYAAGCVCSPTRAALITGLYPARVHITHAIGSRPGPAGTNGDPAQYRDPRLPVVEPDFARRLDLKHPTIAQRLRDAGYVTAIVGKWHLGDVGPKKCGFDHVIGSLNAAQPHSYHPPYQRALHFDDAPKDEYLTDRLTNEAIAFMAAQKDQPFFLYLSHYAVHSPYQAKKKLIEKYRNKTAAPDAPHRNPVYAAMIESLDDSVGRVVKAIDDLGLADRTIVIFTSDNGGRRDHKHAGVPDGHVTSNAPLRGYKAEIYEGGFRVPTMIHWPGVTAASLNHTPMTTVDFYPTLLEMAGVAADAQSAATDLDGVSLVPLLRGAESLDREAIFFHFPHYCVEDWTALRYQFTGRPAAAVRMGDWKLIHVFGSHDELYNLADDLGETRNLADEDPARAAAMKARLMTWLDDSGAQIPEPNADYNVHYASQRIVMYSMTAAVALVLVGLLVRRLLTARTPMPEMIVGAPE